ncbi:hypothetical protein ACFY7Y_28940 [Streptomyces virginiae]|uniref:hypothetical protein n=1 Tax=Streptomyces virginiae TaxID=1961 RepID=UPI00367A7F1A
MPVGDFLPLVQYGPPTEVVLFDNSSLGTAESEASVSGLPSWGRRSGTRPAWPSRCGRCVRGPRGAAPAAHEGCEGRGPAPGTRSGGRGHGPGRLSIPPRTGAGTVTGFVRSVGRVVGDAGVERMIRTPRSDPRDVPRP